jgi:hypothetical protein
MGFDANDSLILQRKHAGMRGKWLTVDDVSRYATIDAEATALNSKEEQSSHSSALSGADQILYGSPVDDCSQDACKDTLQISSSVEIVDTSITCISALHHASFAMRSIGRNWGCANKLEVNVPLA